MVTQRPAIPVITQLRQFVPTSKYVEALTNSLEETLSVTADLLLTKPADPIQFKTEPSQPKSDCLDTHHEAVVVRRSDRHVLLSNGPCVRASA